MLYACDQRFDVTKNLENFCKLNKALLGFSKNTRLCSMLVWVHQKYSPMQHACMGPYNSCML